MSFLKSLKDKQAENNELDWRRIAFFLGVVVYGFVLLYAGVRSLSLFQRTIAPAYFPLAVLGVVAMELSAVALPLTIHYGTAPGIHRNWALGFYAVDGAMIIFNAILDAAHQTGDILPAFMSGYNTYGLPALPILCAVGWTVLWILDPESQRRDAIAALRHAMQDSLTEQIELAAGNVDVTDVVEEAARERARDLAALVVGSRSKPKLSAPTINSVRADNGIPALTGFAAEVDETPPQLTEAPVSKNRKGGTISN